MIELKKTKESITLNVPMTFIVNETLASTYNPVAIRVAEYKSSNMRVSGFLRRVIDVMLDRYQNELMAYKYTIVEITEGTIKYLKNGEIVCMSVDTYLLLQEAAVDLKEAYDQNELPFGRISSRLAKHIVRFMMQNDIKGKQLISNYDYDVPESDIALIADELLNVIIVGAKLN